MRDKYTDKEIEVLLKNLCVIIDTREQQFEHIRSYFEDKKINYRVEKLQQGDYSCCILSNTDTEPLGITRDKYFDKEIVIERKASLDEIANNMKEPDRTRLKKEFSYLKAKNTIVKFLVEDATFDYNLRFHKYRSQYNPKALNGSLKDFESEFGFTIRPIDKQFIGSEIYNILYYHVKGKLLGKW